MKSFVVFALSLFSFSAFASGGDFICRSHSADVPYNVRTISVSAEGQDKLKMFFFDESGNLRLKNAQVYSYTGFVQKSLKYQGFLRFKTAQNDFGSEGGLPVAYFKSNADHALLVFPGAGGAVEYPCLKK